MNDYIFDKDYITNIKKNIINYISRTNVNVNKVTFNLSLYTKFVISDIDDTSIRTTLPKIDNRKVMPANVEIGKGYFNIIKGVYYIKPEYEDILANRLTKILVKGAAIKFKYENMVPVFIEGVGLEHAEGNGFDNAFVSAIAEDIEGYVIPPFNDVYSFNKGIIRMILAIVGYKYGITTYFNHDKSLFVGLYSLSVDSNIFTKINKKLTLIEMLIDTINSNDAVMTSFEKEITEKLIHTKKADLINMIINKLYIPYINSVHLDKRKQVRDEILKGFLGINYASLKLNEENKENYYWASLVNNTVAINNKVTDQSWAYYREQVIKENNNNLHDIYARYALNKAKNNIKEFWVVIDKNNIYIDTGKKIVKEKELVNEMLSYAYISSIDDDLKEKIENGIIKLCSSRKEFTSRLNSNPLSNRMLTAAIIQLAKKNGYTIELIDVDNNIASFKLKEPLMK